MSRIRSENTKPELIVHSALHRMGYRFRLQGKVNKKICKKGVLPGKPDIVMPKYRTVVFVHGCFWHCHKNCRRSTIPKSNKKYWVTKLKRNVERDIENLQKIEQLGWRVIVLWECEIHSDTIIKLLEQKLC